MMYERILRSSRFVANECIGNGNSKASQDEGLKQEERGEETRLIILLQEERGKETANHSDTYFLTFRLQTFFNA
jgi:hypothetical protein